MTKVLMKGNEALGEAAIRAGCVHFFGYPITPQTEVPEYLVKRLPEVGGVFVQAESEVASINMIYGAAAAGERTMTGSSGPGISLMQEGMSYLAGAELPCVIADIMRGTRSISSPRTSLWSVPARSPTVASGGRSGRARPPTPFIASVSGATFISSTAFDIAESMPAMAYWVAGSLSRSASSAARLSCAIAWPGNATTAATVAASAVLRNSMGCSSFAGHGLQ